MCKCENKNMLKTPFAIELCMINADTIAQF